MVNLNRRPLLSICISTFNRADWLKVSLQNLERLLPEFNPDVEIVVCDNASPGHISSIGKILKILRENSDLALIYLNYAYTR